MHKIVPIQHVSQSWLIRMIWKAKVDKNFKFWCWEISITQFYKDEKYIGSV